MDKKMVSDKILRMIKRQMKENNGDLDTTLISLLKEGKINEPFTRKEKIFVASILNAETDALYDYSSIHEFEERNPEKLGHYIDEDDINDMGSI